MANRYRDIKTFPLQEGGRYMTNPVYPEIKPSSEDFYVITTAGDRFDILAQQFYSDVHLWWIIASANNMFNGSLAIPIGVQLRIPADKDRIVQLYEQVNKGR
jgi:hypothetical protein